MWRKKGVNGSKSMWQIEVWSFLKEIFKCITPHVWTKPSFKQNIHVKKKNAYLEKLNSK